MEGYGELMWLQTVNGQEVKLKQYIGQFSKDQFQGSGQLNFQRNEGQLVSYFGNFEQSQFEGEGELIEADGSKYKGTFEKGVYHGKGKLTRNQHENGFLAYEGDFRFGNFEGKGVISYRSSTNEFKVKGFFQCGRLLQDRNCEVEFANGDLYRGELHAFNLTGKGIYFMLHKKQVFVGTFQDGTPEGICKQLIGLSP